MSVRPYKKRNGEEVPGVWEIQFYPEGRAGGCRRMRYPLEGTCTRAQALTIEQECRRLNVTNYKRHNINPAINDILPEYLEWHKLHRAARTHSDLLYSLKGLVAVFGNLPVSRITPAEVTRFKALRPTHPRAVNKDLHYLGAIISWMVKNNYAQALPFKIEQLPYSKPIPRPPMADDVEKFLAEVKEPDKRAICIMMFEAGTRWNETVSLRWEDVDLGQGVAMVMGKGSKWRAVLLPARVLEIITPLAKPSGYVFPNPKTGKPYGSFKTLFRLACKRAGVREFHAHGLRHRAATDTLEASGDLRLVQKMLGHADIQTTTIYTQIDMGRLRKAAEKVQDHRRRHEP